MQLKMQLKNAFKTNLILYERHSCTQSFSIYPGKKNAFSTLDFGNAFAKLQIQKKNCGFCKCIFMDFANAFS
jgi:hypothetical protein